MARNGYLSEDGIVLVTVEDDDQLIPTAAAAFFAARAAAAADGVHLTIVEPAGAYRPAWVQNDMVDHPERWNLNPASSIKFSRYGQSHGFGNRIDINSAAVSWMLRRGNEFGWIREYGARDPNHFKHDGKTAIVGAAAVVASQRVKRRTTVTTNYVKTSTGDKAGGEGSLWATAGDAGMPCPGNWIEFTRTPADGGNEDQGSRMAAAHGSAIFLTDAEWDAYKSAYTTPAPAGTVKVEIAASAFAPLLSALEALRVDVQALPAEIDRYADGKKQSA